MHDNEQQSQEAPRGIISLLALILMATVTATAVGAAAIILTEVRQTESLDQSISAVYAAEAGLEDGLYLVKVNREILTLQAALSQLGSTDHRTALPNVSTWTRSSAAENRLFLPSLPADKVAYLDIYNPDDPGSRSNIESIWVNWAVNCDQLVELETTMLTWYEDPDTGVITFDPATQRVFKHKQACNQGPPPHACDDNYILSNIVGVNGAEDINPERPYRFSFRVLVPENSICAAEDLVVTAYNDPSPGSIPQEDLPDHYVDIPTRIEVKATGTFARSKQALTATVPWKAPISGLLGFVVFSDEGITK